MKIFVIGDEITIHSFQLVGVDGKIVSPDTEPLDLLNILNEAFSNKENGLIVVNRFVQKNLGDKFESFLTSAQPLVFVVPDTDEEIQEENLNQYIQQVIGIKL